MTHNEPEARKRKRRAPGDEGSAYTARIAAEVAGRRTTLGWSAGRLAEEMAAVGVPWTRDVVVNLENGRRRILAVHELLALAYVLEVESPVDLLVPSSADPVLPVIPSMLLDKGVIRGWLLGRTGPLRPLMDKYAGPESAQVARIKDALREFGADRFHDYEGLVVELARLTVSSDIANAINAIKNESGEGEDADGSQ